MSIAFILLGTLPASLIIVSKMGLGNPPQAHLVIETTPIKPARSSREDIQLAA